MHFPKSNFQVIFEFLILHFFLCKKIIKIGRNLAQFHVKLNAVIVTMKVKCVIKHYFRPNLKHWTYLINCILSDGLFDLFIFDLAFLKIYWLLDFLLILYFWFELYFFDSHVFTFNITHSNKSKTTTSNVLNFFLILVSISIKI